MSKTRIEACSTIQAFTSILFIFGLDLPSDDPDAQLDWLDRRPVVDPALGVQWFLEMMAAPTGVVGRRRSLFQSMVTTPLHLDLLRGRDGLTKLLVGIQP